MFPQTRFSFPSFFPISRVIVSPLYFLLLPCQLSRTEAGLQEALLTLKAFPLLKFQNILQNVGHSNSFYNRILLSAPKARHNLSSSSSSGELGTTSGIFPGRLESEIDQQGTSPLHSILLTDNCLFHTYESRQSSQFVRVTLLKSFTSKRCTRILLPAV